MSTENSEFAVPEVVADEKEVTKEIKGTKRPSEVSIPIKLQNESWRLQRPKRATPPFVIVTTAPHESVCSCCVCECACVFFAN